MLYDYHTITAIFVKRTSIYLYIYNNVGLPFQTQNPMVVHVYHPYRQPDGVNHCAAVNGHCSHLCLPAPQITSKSPKISCACPNGLMLMSDGLMCAEEGKRRYYYYIILFDLHNRYYNLYYYHDTLYYSSLSTRCPPRARKR